MIVHLFIDSAILETAYSNIFKLLKWQCVNHQADAFCSFGFETDDEQFVLLSAPFSPELGCKIRQKISENPNLAIVLFLDTKYSSDIGEILDLIRAVVPSNASEDQIKNIMHLAAEGYFILPKQYHHKASVAEHEDALSETTAAHRAAAAHLTVRELQILQQITNGYANKQIARRLHISLNTVQVHNSSIFRKLGVGNRTQAAHDFQQNKMYLLLQAQDKEQTKQSAQIS